MSHVEKFLHEWVEKSSFGVCRYLANKWGLDESKVRMYFIYSSFAAFGSPVILYLATAFWVNIRKYIRRPSIS
jgi:phage shock protein C